MSLDESLVIEPPESGWPNITVEAVKWLGKTEEVSLLLQRLPYIAHDDEVQVAPDCVFADWNYLFHPHRNKEIIQIYIEGPHFGLTSSGRGDGYGVVLLLGTTLGIVNRVNCPSEIMGDLDVRRKRVRYDGSKVDPSESDSDNEDANSNEEAEESDEMDDTESVDMEDEEDWGETCSDKAGELWRDDAGSWLVADFFEFLKDQFRELKYVPFSSTEVFDHHHAHVIPMVQDIYRQHGWPDLERYNKQECMAALEKALEERGY
ncbi:hypothetical protein QBC38DRAFT_461929 [Podospora fimiseda]|uniref:Uncharacterized protein n=1 Tax=Podospora fimiseda TaxID=252190 RepID=A0AAN6YN20_9PEZI|nr:hypothetical protein QBC38DRAFT_461929 [Podospora fimiseda]